MDAEMKSILSFTLASVALLASPGPATVALAASGASYGFRQSLSFYFGIIVGLVPVISVVASGTFVALKTLPYASMIVFTISVVYILYLAGRIAMAPPMMVSRKINSPGFPAGFILGITNIKAYAVLAALFGGFVLTWAGQWDVVIKAAICMGVIVIFDFLWLMMGNSLRHLFIDPVLNRAVNIGLALVMVVMVAWSIWTGRHI